MDAPNCIAYPTQTNEEITCSPFTYELCCPSELPLSDFCQRLLELFETDGIAQSSSVIVEMCRFQLQGETCKFHPHCKYAHNYRDVLPVERRKDYFKVRTCKTFEKYGACKYGTRCQFIHDECMWVLNDTLSVYFSEHENTYRIALNIGENRSMVISYGTPQDESTIVDEKLRTYLPLLRSLDNYSNRTDPAQRFTRHLNELAKKQTTCQIEQMEQAAGEIQTSAQLANVMSMRFEAGNQTVLTAAPAAMQVPSVPTMQYPPTMMHPFCPPPQLPMPQLPVQQHQQQQHHQMYPQSPPQAFYSIAGYPTLTTDSAAELPYAPTQTAWYPPNSTIMQQPLNPAPMMIPHPYYPVHQSSPTDMFMATSPVASPVANGSPVLTYEIPQYLPQVAPQFSPYGYPSVLSPTFTTSPTSSTMPAPPSPPQMVGASASSQATQYMENQLLMANYFSMSPAWAPSILTENNPIDSDAKSNCSGQSVPTKYNGSEDDYLYSAPALKIQPLAAPMTLPTSSRTPPGFFAEPQFARSMEAPVSTALEHNDNSSNNYLQSLVQVNRRQEFKATHNVTPITSPAPLLPLLPLQPIQTNVPHTPEYVKNCVLVQTPPNKHKEMNAAKKKSNAAPFGVSSENSKKQHFNSLFKNLNVGDDLENQRPSELLA